MPYPRKPHTTSVLPNTSIRARNPSENPVKSQVHAELWEHTVAFTQSPQQAPAGLKHHLDGQSRTFSVSWHAAVRGWCFWGIWRSFLQETVPDFSLPQRAEKVKQGPLTGSQVLFSALGTDAGCYLSFGRRQAINKSFGSEVNATSQSHYYTLFQLFLQVFFYPTRVYHRFTLLPISVLWGCPHWWENNIPTLIIGIKKQPLHICKQVYSTGMTEGMFSYLNSGQ